MEKNIYYNYDKLLSYNCLLYFVIGERGVGKTYGAKDYCINHYKKKKKKFAWVRRYGSDLESAIGTTKNPEFFKAIQDKHNGNYSIIESKKIKYLALDDKIIGYGMSLKMAESLKGTEFNDVDTIIFDEFLVGDGGSRYLKDEPMYLLSLIESIARFRKIRVILLGNATSTINPYFDFFGIHLPYKSNFQTFKRGTIVVNYIKNEAYRKAKKESEFGQLVKGTPYEYYAIDNKFINDNSDFIKKRSNKAKLFFNIVLNNNPYGIWIDGDEMFISKACNLKHQVILSFDYTSHNENTIMIKSNSVFMKNIQNHYNRGKLFFENQKIKHYMIDLLKKARLIY